jgi:hypothetical protein
MKQLLKPAAFSLFMFVAISTVSFTNQADKVHNTASANKVPRIQVAILLDVSNSMDGLIGQARTQLWNMVNTLGKVKCDGGIAPKIEIALYEYGRTSNNKADGYVMQINGFISDLDSLSQNLFRLTTNGGDEFCGHVLYSSLMELKWDTNPENYKVIFIAGNEDFLQGDIHYTKACMEAKQKGVIVNTIYCGDKTIGISEHWNLAEECGNGSFSTINQNAAEEDIPTPYDSMIYVMNDRLNRTYIAYGVAGAGSKERQLQMDVMYDSLGNQTASMKRITVKSDSILYNNARWDAVDAIAISGRTPLAYENLRQELPDSLKKKSPEELKKYIDEKAKDRSKVQKEISTLSNQRDAYIAAEKAKRAAIKNNGATLETEVERIIKEQVKRYKMTIK